MLLAVSACGAPTGFDSGEPRWRRKTERIAIDPIARNSDCQFCNVRFQKSDVVTYVGQETVAALMVELVGVVDDPSGERLS